MIKAKQEDVSLHTRPWHIGRLGQAQCGEAVGSPVCTVEDDGPTQPVRVTGNQNHGCCLVCTPKKPHAGPSGTCTQHHFLFTEGDSGSVLAGRRDE